MIPGASAPTEWPVRFVEIQCADGRWIEGLCHEPATDPWCQLLLLHGKGGNCYSGMSRHLPRALAAIGVRTLALNMRCHDLGYTRYDVPFVDIEHGHTAVDGGMWEIPEQAGLDVRAGVDTLASYGDQPIAVGGHSSGAFYAATGTAGDGRVAARILLSPLTSNRRPLPLWFGSSEALAAAVSDAQDRVACGHEHELLPVATWYYAISAGSLVARAGEGEDIWFDSLAAGETPVLMAWGSEESRADAWSAIFRAMPEPKTAVILQGAEHNYIGFEHKITDAVEHFLRYLT